MTTFYNEIDPFALKVLKNLADAGYIFDGERCAMPIQNLDVDLSLFTKCHFFAGMGTWDYALRIAGWPSTLPVWTGSCPCQPFSIVGTGAQFHDPRYLWPAWFFQIQKYRPSIIFGEQVASPVALEWFDAVADDLEGEGYTVGAADLCATSVDSPHARQRLYFVAYSPMFRYQTRDDSVSLTTTERGLNRVASGDVLDTNISLRLNPKLSCWLQGLPPGWDECLVTVME